MTGVGERRLTDLVAYYAARASEYDKVYLKPGRQGDIERLAAMLAGELSGHRILEIACVLRTIGWRHTSSVEVTAP